jgi:hypothetical protein
VSTSPGAASNINVYIKVLFQNKKSWSSLKKKKSQQKVDKMGGDGKIIIFVLNVFLYLPLHVSVYN